MNIVASLIYWVIVCIWTVVLCTAAAFYIANRRTFGTTKLLLAVLALDALRNIVENVYFGFYFGSKFGLFGPVIAQYLGTPGRLILPKIANIAAGCVVLGLLLLRWLPTAIRERTEAETETEVLHELASIDSMTGLQNRRDFLAKTEAEWQRAKRYAREMSLVILDIDQFKAINDRFGHATGDLVITTIARICQETKRVSDIAGRLGGEEFAILLPETGIDAANLYANRLREVISRKTPKMLEGGIAATVSIGVSSVTAAETVAELFKHADAALYQAKHAGRNVVRCFAEHV
jgi:diguanylate cyclase (GGDEF)-like protein